MNTKEKIKIFWKPFVLLFLISFVIINWADIGWVFNYRVISGIVSDFFQEDNQEAIVNPEEIQEEQSIEIEKFEYSEKENSIEIPILGISAPLIFVESSNENEDDIYKALDRGVVHFPNSVLPGEIGQTIILGHSAPSGWPKIKYDWVFSEINQLEKGDEVFVYFDHKKYPYYITRKIFLEKGEEILDSLTSSENMLFLISCWPPGKDLRRIVVEAALNK